ncbi:uncharacterized protein LOC131893370 [Tigriopus californicus]|uniref:uncharacterized protein LOC131893370 n=1 Tax=Tigriopus californicus TaxID=6832 RepID=UPI0027DA92F4|nr:uncharacterized protein LOC131893370 [Tigriopus californicus]
MSPNNDNNKSTDSYVDQAANATNSALHTVKDTANNAMDSVNQAIYGKEQSSVDKTIDSSAQSTKETLHTVQDKTQETKDDIADKYEEMTKTDEEKRKEESLVHQASEMASDAFSYVKDSVSKVVYGKEESSIDKYVDQTADQSKAAAHTMEDQYQDAKTATSEAVYGQEKDEIDRTVESYAEATKHALHESQETADNMKRSAEETYESTADYTDRKAKAAKEVGLDLKNDLSEAATLVKNDLSEASSRLTEA